MERMVNDQQLEEKTVEPSRYLSNENSAANVDEADMVEGNIACSFSYFSTLRSFLQMERRIRTASHWHSSSTYQSRIDL
jgi:hypothetical protein